VAKYDTNGKCNGRKRRENGIEERIRDGQEQFTVLSSHRFVGPGEPNKPRQRSFAIATPVVRTRPKNVLPLLPPRPANFVSLVRSQKSPDRTHTSLT